jgi:hypothetical protein
MRTFWLTSCQFYAQCIITMNLIKCVLARIYPSIGNPNRALDHRQRKCDPEHSNYAPEPPTRVNSCLDWAKRTCRWWNTNPNTIHSGRSQAGVNGDCTAVFISVDAILALTPMKTAVCCDSLWSPMFDASRQPLCKLLYMIQSSTISTAKWHQLNHIGNR